MAPSLSSDFSEQEQGLVGRHLILCPRLSTFDIDDLIVTCPVCDDFVLYCCACSRTKRDDYGGRPCHHFRLVFTDGACVDNGQPGASSGVGAAYGKSKGAGYNAPITEDLDPDQKRTNQRAELLAVCAGLDLIVAAYEVNREDTHSKEEDEYNDDGEKINKTENWIVTTDSEYVVKGITEWFPRWRRRGWRTASGAKPANLDLFQKIDQIINEGEAQRNIKIGFWHVDRQYNELADSLAKAAAQDAKSKYISCNSKRDYDAYCE
ncbi:MAG: hypothetical protein Q9167_003591 [Letrouitia subvulpina]